MKNSTRERLSFLVRIIKKDLKHLEYSVGRLQSSNFTLEKAENLDQNPELGEVIEAFTSRFARLQDTVGDKLLPAWLAAVGENRGTAIDNLDKAEKFGLLSSTDDWMTLRYLRNQLVHEYLETAEEKLAAVNACLKGVKIVKDFAANLISDIERRAFLT